MVFGIEIDTEANVCLVIAAAHCCFNKDLMDCVAREQESQTFHIAVML